MMIHILRQWRGLALGLMLVLASGLQGCFLLHIGSHSGRILPREIMAPAVDVDRGTGADKIRQLDPEGKIRSHGPQLVA